ncbi:HlyD family efflux transporter periplasmic adaptor subunit [Lusitaniella coriacea LEGE 07157]|uniref:HlyD family efflux transporter periplasmic adaptor subunit n=1 Tax=Lusitaniella coriacea LEGE 07157 TaxID=945747 RepID=A0A8J7E589_9CYAN|nr:HlyD family efflux transporter periplasmic adaptor subunit [Lusitaniella coriacea]MBE9118529.1 HlyD family efflux transporter periplasmic adaptor subunit [Lusitaniella coriacea LEGE 07157]
MSQDNGKPKTLALDSSPPARPFDRPVILRQSPIWSRAILWTLMGVTVITVIWACVAKIEEAIPAQGKLEPKGAVKDVQAPVGGVVENVRVKEGEIVKTGEVLLTFDQTAAQAEQKSLIDIRDSLVQENNFYRAQMNGVATANFAKLRKSPEYSSLANNRAALVEENQYYQATLQGNSNTAPLNLDQQARFRASQNELESRVAAAQLEIDQLTQQLAQNRVQLANAKNIFAVNKKILDDIRPLMKEGGIPRLQLLRQEQETRTSEAEVIRLTQEEKRLQLAITQAQKQLQNTVALTKNDLYTRIAENNKRISEIDSQLTKVIVENEKRIKEIDSQLSQIKLTLQYQELRSPVSGKVFDLQADSGFVANTSEPILKIVPKDTLVAQVFITNRDIGFVKLNSNVDVRIDSFPYSEFGDVKGTLVRIGSDALPPNEIYPFYRFPAEIQLEQQTIDVNGKPIALQSGMSVSANIKLRKRTVMSIFTDLFARKIDSLKSSH